MSRNVNIYQDMHSGGWICDVILHPCDLHPEWHRVGVFGTRAAAIAAAMMQTV